MASLADFATKYSIVVGVALTGDIEWQQAVRAVHEDGAKFIQTAQYTNDLLRWGGGSQNLGETLRTRKYLLESKEITEALLPMFQKDLGEYGTLTGLYDAILADPSVPGTIKALIGYKKGYIPEKKQILSKGISAATSVLSLYPAVLNTINEVTDEVDRKSNEFRWH